MQDDLAELRDDQSVTGICTGCFDILQSGHAVFFQQCKEYVDRLFVVVGRDSVIGKLKGAGRPINPQNNRLYLVAALEAVDYAVLGDRKVRPGKIDCYNVVQALRPDKYILNKDDGGLTEKRELCRSFGMELVTVPRVVPEFLTPTSTTEIVRKAAESRAKRKQNS